MMGCTIASVTSRWAKAAGGAYMIGSRSMTGPRQANRQSGAEGAA
ncbi:hypothetical protein [Azospirillum endophyticum]